MGCRADREYCPEYEDEMAKASAKAIRDERDREILKSKDWTACSDEEKDALVDLAISESDFWVLHFQSPFATDAELDANEKFLKVLSNIYKNERATNSKTHEQCVDGLNQVYKKLKK